MKIHLGSRVVTLDPESPDGKQLLMMHFFSQGFPDNKVKLICLERGPLTPQAEALAVAFKVYHGRNEKVCRQKYLTMVKVSQLAKAEAQAPWPPKA